MVSNPLGRANLRCSSDERRANATYGELDVADHERRFDANAAISGALERRITTGVSASALGVILAVDLNHETLRGSQEVCDEATEQRHLPAKDHAELPAAEMVPQELLGCSERAAHRASALREDRRALAASRRKRGLVVGSSHAPKGAGAVTAPDLSRLIETGLARRVRPLA